MAQADRIYKKAFSRHFANHMANYPLAQNVKLGDYGTIKDGYFVKVGNLGDAPFNLDLEILLDTNPTQEEFQSTSSVSIKHTAKGDVNVTGVVAVKASIDIGFSAENAIFFSSANVLYNELKNLPVIGEKILSLYKQGKWEKRYHIITKILEAKKTVVIISGASDCSVSIEAQADVPKINLANLSVALQFSKSEKVSYKIITNDTCQLGFGLSRIYNPLFNQPSFKAKSNLVHQLAAMDESKIVDNQNLVFGDTVADSFA